MVSSRGVNIWSPSKGLERVWHASEQNTGNTQRRFGVSVHIKSCMGSALSRRCPLSTCQEPQTRPMTWSVQGACPCMGLAQQALKAVSACAVSPLQGGCRSQEIPLHHGVLEPLLERVGCAPARWPRAASSQSHRTALSAVEPGTVARTCYEGWLHARNP